ncbi:NAD-dependent epimerase/dehydratase family protein [Candidatus Parvarchaeota archaeon]|nr:NAD-dependent epimerase/dehydratase family protein [Candidatus Parvarchaeota archaeon]
MAVVVTGASGFIGAHLCKKLFETTGQAPLNIDIREPKAGDLAFCKHIKADVRDAARMLECTKGASAIIHLAAQTSVQKSLQEPTLDWETNYLGTKNMLEAARKNDVGVFVYASSAAIYGHPKYLPVDEKHPKSPLSPYGMSKLAADELCGKYFEQHGLKTVRLRLFNVYGVGQDPASPYSGVITKFAQKIKDGKPPIVFGDGSNTRDFVHISDVVDAFLACIEQKNTKKITEKGASGSGVYGKAYGSGIYGKAYNIGTGIETSILELAKKMVLVSGKKLGVEFAPTQKGDIAKSVAEVSAARREIGFEATVKLGEGLKELV